jgi:hypothetical protein
MVASKYNAKSSVSSKGAPGGNDGGGVVSFSTTTDRERSAVGVGGVEIGGVVVVVEAIVIELVNGWINF